MIESRLVLDTNAIIFLTDRGSVIPSVLQEALNTADLFISVITEMELFAKSTLSFNEEKSLLDFLSDRISVVDLSNEIKKEAIAIRRTAGLKLPDSIVAATAIVLNAVLLTDDKQLLRLTRSGYTVKILV